MKKKIIGLLGLLCIMGFILSSCAVRTYGDVLNTWMNNDVNDLIQKWGAPSKVYTMPNGNRTFIWFEDNGTVISASGYLQYSGVKLWCKTEFTVNRNDKIIWWHYSGNNCPESKIIY